MTLDVQYPEAEIKRLMRGLEPQRMKRAAKRAMEFSGRAMKTALAVYPPAGPWNRPRGPGKSWYVRGHGGRYLRKRDGGVSSWNTSENFQQSWQHGVDAWDRVRIWNTASYGNLLMGEDSDRVSWAKSHGWKTYKDVYAQKRPAILKALGDELMNELLRA